MRVRRWNLQDLTGGLRRVADIDLSGSPSTFYENMILTESGSVRTNPGLLHDIMLEG
jgi:hypothetical protein